MLHLALLALALPAIVSSLVVPRATAPAGYNAALLEPYNTYHTRYMALSCITKHNTGFFDQCCHPLLAKQSLSSRPAQCDPAHVNDNTTDDDNLPFCDDDDDDNSGASSVVVPAPAPTPKAPAPVKQSPTPAAPSPTPKPAAPKPAPAPVTPPSDTSVNTGGFATFFFQNGVAGACGTVHKDGELIAAIDEARYGNSGKKSSLCGQKVKITNTKNQKTVTVTIADDCPTCVNRNSIDLSTGAFNQIATPDEGMVPITWQFV